MKYVQGYDGERIRPKRRGYRVRCCGCGLIHIYNFYVRKGHVEYQVTRDKRATAAYRKRHGIKITRKRK